MLSLFRTNQSIANFFLVFYAAIYRILPFFFGTQEWSQHSGILSESTLAIVGSGPFSYILALLLVCFQALLINTAVASYRITNEVSLFPGLFYILVSSSIPEFQGLSAPLLANTFYILALMELFKTYKKYSSAAEIFNVGLWLAIGSLFYFSMISFVLLAIFGLVIVRAFRPKEIVMFLCGFFAPYFLINVYYFWTDRWPYFWQHHFADNFGFFDFAASPLGWEHYVKLGFFALLVIFAIVNYSRFNFKKTIQVQKYINILYLGLLCAGLALMLQANTTLQHLLLLAPPLGIFLSFTFLNLNRQLAATLHLLLLFLLLILQCKPLWMA
ncbi:MAG: DUF6427 family protein [Bacteroidota bacterium]